MQKFKGRVAVITGGASGIGLGLARRFAAEGMKVVIADINDADLKAAAGQLTAAGADVLAQRTDVSKPQDIQALADATVARFGAAHILCNNAGVGGYQRFGSASAATWEWELGVNLWGPIHGCRIFLPILERQDEAHIVNTASVAAFYSSPYLQPYCVSKAGVAALTESLWREFALEKPHIGVSVLCPAQVATAIGDDERNAPPGYKHRSAVDHDLEIMRANLKAGLAAGKTPDEVADIVIQGIRERRLYILTHPEWVKVVQMRAEDIVAGAPLRNIGPTTFKPA